MPHVVWAEESRSGLRFEIRPSNDVVPARSQLVTDGQTRCTCKCTCFYFYVSCVRSKNFLCNVICLCFLLFMLTRGAILGLKNRHFQLITENTQLSTVSHTILIPDKLLVVWSLIISCVTPIACAQLDTM